MAKIDSVEPFGRYDGISTGRVFAYLFETQEGIPVDGTNELLRQLSPFTIRLVPPDSLLSASGENSADIIQAAARMSSQYDDANRVAEALSASYPVGTAASSYESLLSGAVLSGIDVNGLYPAISDVYAAADIALQLKTMVEAPPLTLLVNPTSLNVSYSKIQSFGTKTRGSSLFQAWGEEQTNVSISGSTAGFVAGVSPGGFVDSRGMSPSASGYIGAAKNESAAWQNFMALYLFYRNNGYIFDTVGNTDAHQFVGAVAIEYDQWSYVGYFSDFSFEFSSESPHKVTFNTSFIASRVYDWHEPSYSVLPQAPVMSEEDVAAVPFELF